MSWTARIATPPPVKVEKSAGRYARCYDAEFGLRRRQPAAVAETEWPETVIITEGANNG